jgi:hypothetical protein
VGKLHRPGRHRRNRVDVPPLLTAVIQRERLDNLRRLKTDGALPDEIH